MATMISVLPAGGVPALVTPQLWEHGRMGPTKVFCSMYGRVLTIATAVIAVLAAVVQVGQDLGAALVTLAGGALVTCLVWMLFWRPRVEVSDGGIDVRNVVRSVHVRGRRTQAYAPSGRSRWTTTAARSPHGPRPVRAAAASGCAAGAADPPTRAAPGWEGERRGGGRRDRRAPRRADRVRIPDGRPCRRPGARSTWNVVELAALGSLAVATVVLTVAT
ncbi:hypothetical protein NKG05_23385 [Oerskovia sp. M15]